MRKPFIFFLVSAVMTGAAFPVSAASVFDITYPIAELENCATREACKAYCDDLSHANTCSAFAQTYGLASKESAAAASKLPEIGPGGCKSESECRSYCDDAGHFDECIAFGEQHGLMTKKEVDQARKAVANGPGGCKGAKECQSYCNDEEHGLECAEYGHKQGFISDSDYQTIKQVKQGGGPGGCKNQAECQSYCENPDHLDACLSFGEENGFISREQAVTVRKAGFGGGPGGCKGQEACRQFCEAPEHQSECIAFAEEKGFMSKEEAQRARKFSSQTGPGGCKGNECRTYCENPEHAEECLEHAEREGLLPKEEVDRARKFVKIIQEGGPGGCKGREQCEAYCQDQSHREECFQFGKKQGLISSEEEKKIEAGFGIQKAMEQGGGPGGCKEESECSTYCSDGSHVEECIAFASVHGGISEQQAQEMVKEFTTQKFRVGGGGPEDFMRHQQEGSIRFQEFQALEKQFRGPGSFGPQGMGGKMGMPPPPGGFPGQQPGGFGGQGEGTGQDGFVGPGGCTSPSECIRYCSTHQEECFSQKPAFDQPQEHREGGFGGPQGDRGGFFPQGGNFDHPPFMPQVREDNLRKFNSEDLPEGFDARSPEERQEFFMQKFQEFRGEQGAFPGMPSQGFPGQQQQGFQPYEQGGSGGPQEFDSFKGIGPMPGTPGILSPIDGQQRSYPPGQFPPPGQYPPQGEGGMMYPPREGDQHMMPPPSDGQYKQYPSGSTEGYHPPPTGTDGGTYQRQPPPPPGSSYPTQQYPSGDTGSYPPPPSGTYQHEEGGSAGNYPPPPTGTSDGTYQQPPPPSSDGQYQQYPSGSMESYPPPPTGTDSGTYEQPPPPSSRAPGNGFFGNLLLLLFGN